MAKLQSESNYDLAETEISESLDPEETAAWTIKTQS
jgi:hypothetical protein